MIQNRFGQNPIIVALDTESIGGAKTLTPPKALKLAGKLKGRVWGFKVNDLISEGREYLLHLKQFGRLFVDAKFHDTPESVRNSVARLAKINRVPENPGEATIIPLADFITVHASGGLEMMKAARTQHAKILAVTALTSLSPEDIKTIYRRESSEELVRDLATLAVRAIMDGVVLSGHELEALNRYTEFRNLIKVVPGIRPEWYQTPGSHQRPMTPAKAIKLGADYLVIGRPITKVANPVAAVEEILKEIDLAKPLN